MRSGQLRNVPFGGALCYTIFKNALSRECGNERNVMLNEDKIRLMNEIAMFRKNEWKSERPARM